MREKVGLAYRAVCSSLTSWKANGQAVLEFSIVLPFFVALLLLAVDFGVWMSTEVAVANAAREGARFAAVNCGGVGCTDGSAILTRVQQRSGGIVDNTSWVTVWWRDVDTTSPQAPNGSLPGRGDSFAVRINYPHRLLFFRWFPPLNVTACAEMVLEGDDLNYTHSAGQDTRGVAVSPSTCP